MIRWMNTYASKQGSSCSSSRCLLIFYGCDLTVPPLNSDPLFPPLTSLQLMTDVLMTGWCDSLPSSGRHLASGVPITHPTPSICGPFWISWQTRVPYPFQSQWKGHWPLDDFSIWSSVLCSGPKWTYFQPGTKSISAAVLPVLGTKSILAAVLPVLDPQSVEVYFLPQLECIDIGAPDPFSNLPSRYARSTIFNSCPLLYPLFQWPICQT